MADVEARMQDTPVRLAATDDTIATVLMVSAGAVTIFGVYLAVHNVLLFKQGRRWSHRRARDTG